MFYFKKNETSIRDIFVKFWVWYSFFVFATTELLSIFNLIDRKVFVLIYIFAFGVLIFIFWKNRSNIKFYIKPNRYWLGYLILTVVIFAPLLLIALYYPPNNWDSMTYHLPRVEHWIQNKNIAFYATNNSRQLFLSPMAEYVILHWRILLGEDNLVNLVQYVSMILSVLTATLIVKKWKGNKMTELLAATLVATIPMGIMQSTSTQNDYVTAFFAIASLYFYLKNDILLLAISIGLGIFTKSTFIIFVLPLGLYWFITWLKRDSHGVGKIVCLILFFIILINGLQWYRNYQYFGSMFGDKVLSEAMFNKSLAPKYMFSNIIRNFGTQIGLPIKKYNDSVDNFVEDIHFKLGIKSNDIVNTWYSEKYNTQFSINEDLSGNIIIFILFFVSGVVLIIKKYSVWPTYLFILLGWLLFSILLKWQPWHSRLELPFFVLACPIVGFVLDKYIANKYVSMVVLVLMILMSFVFVVGYCPVKMLNEDTDTISNRPIIEDLFLFRKTRYERFLSESIYNGKYHEISREIYKIGIKDIIFDLGSDSREYPLWYSFRNKKLNIKVHNIIESEKTNGFVISDKTISSKYNSFSVIFSTGDLKLYSLTN